MAVDTGGNVLAYSGTSWGSPSSIDSSRGIKSVSCPTSSFCAATDANGYAVTYNGSTWSTPSDIDGSTAMYAVSCASASSCAAVDATGHVLTYNGTSWASPVDIDSTRSFNAVSCPTTSFCAAVDSSGHVVTYNGTSWSSASDVDGSNNFKGISCPSSSFCAAVDTTGHVVTYNGSTWASALDIDGTTTLYAISCPTSSFCVAVDNAGSALTYNGSSWSSPSNIDGTKTFNAVSCASASFCQAVDSSGEVLSDGAANVTSQFDWKTNGSLSLVLSDGKNDYVYGAGSTPVEEVNLATSTPTFMTYTPSDSSWLTTNSAGDETGFWGYDAFGNLAFGIPTSPFGYAGQYTDASTGLSNMRARWYQPQTGGFTSRDPDFASTDTGYTYAGDDPVNGLDPSGAGSSQLHGFDGITAGQFYFSFDATTDLGRVDAQVYEAADTSDLNFMEFDICQAASLFVIYSGTCQTRFISNIVPAFDSDTVTLGDESTNGPRTARDEFSYVIEALTVDASTFYKGEDDDRPEPAPVSDEQDVWPPPEAIEEPPTEEGGGGEDDAEASYSGGCGNSPNGVTVAGVFVPSVAPPTSLGTPQYGVGLWWSGSTWQHVHAESSDTV
jgi:RHS repeat-associated protein